MKYKIKTGHKNDMFFVVSMDAQGKDKINQIFFHEENAVKWIDKTNKDLEYNKVIR